MASGTKHGETASPGVVALSIPAKAEYIALCRLALAGLTHVRPLDPEALADLKLALTEACSNSIRHAYDEGRAGVVDIRYELNGEKLAVEVADEGAGFKPEDADADGPARDEGGLGIAIIRAVTDELAIESHEHGSRLRFVKYLN
ncbi:MAG: ATP-binding protein [Actinomycetota bacterium]|nr:ATP-binding protein [Actinomycetota bacterium]